MDKVWQKLKEYPSVSLPDKEKQFEIILKRSQKERTAKTRSLFGKYAQVAAASVAILLVSTLAFLLFFQSDVVTYQTSFGETREINLPDGSKVVMNGNSTLSFIPDWNTDEAREVQLAGEAFFSVVHTQNDQQFIVRTIDEVSVEVLGTEFNVHNRRHITKVVLNEGKVKVNIQVDDEKQEVVMAPGESVTYSQTTQEYQKQIVNTETYTSWKDDLLIFEDQSLQEIAHILEDSYGYKIHFANNEISKYKFRASIPTNRLDVIFTMLAKSLDLKIEKDGKEIWLKPN